MTRTAETVQIKGTIKIEKDKAILMDIDLECGDTIRKWIPTSQISKITREDSTNQGYDIVIISQWIYDKLELY